MPNQKNMTLPNVPQTAAANSAMPLTNERDLLLERLKEIEEELFALSLKDQERQRDYEQRVKDMEIQKIEAQLAQEAEALRGEYPEFNVETELENPAFVRLVNSGLPMKTAYEALHLNEIKQQGAQEAGARALEEYKRAALRPDENGISLSQGGILKSGVHSLSKRDRAELARRARLGEIIRF